VDSILKGASKTPLEPWKPQAWRFFDSRACVDFCSPMHYGVLVGNLGMHESYRFRASQTTTSLLLLPILPLQPPSFVNIVVRGSRWR
jgi:hypothetical protein